MTTTAKTTDYTALLNGYYGHVNQVLTLSDGRNLVEIHIADTTEDWECGEWYIDGERIALCDGYNGITWESGFEPTDEIDDLVTSYQICGLLEEAKADATEAAEESDRDRGDLGDRGHRGKERVAGGRPDGDGGDAGECGGAAEEPGGAADPGVCVARVDQ